MEFLPCPALGSSFSFVPQRLHIVTTCSEVESSGIRALVLPTFKVCFLDLKDGELFWTWLCLFGCLILYPSSLYVWSIKAWCYRDIFQGCPTARSPFCFTGSKFGPNFLGCQGSVSLWHRQDLLKSGCCLQLSWCYKISIPNIPSSLSRKATLESSFCNQLLFKWLHHLAGWQII